MYRRIASAPNSPVRHRTESRARISLEARPQDERIEVNGVIGEVDPLAGVGWQSTSATVLPLSNLAKKGQQRGGQHFIVAAVIS